MIKRSAKQKQDDALAHIITCYGYLYIDLDLASMYLDQNLRLGDGWYPLPDATHFTRRNFYTHLNTDAFLTNTYVNVPKVIHAAKRLCRQLAPKLITLTITDSTIKVIRPDVSFLNAIEYQLPMLSKKVDNRLNNTGGKYDRSHYFKKKEL